MRSSFCPSAELKKALSAALLFVLILFFSCGDNHLAGYTDAGENVYYRLHQFGDAEKKITDGDYVKAIIQYTDSNGAVLQEMPNTPDGYTVFQFASNYYLPFSGALKHFSEGDSASVLNETLKLKTDIKIFRVMSAAEYEAEKAKIRQMEELDEHNKINAYITANKLVVDTIGNGLFLFYNLEGKGKEVKRGEKISLSYKGFFLNGRCFDSATVQQPMEFIYGTEGQLVEGLSIAVGRMREGGKSKIIIPSYLAFGEQGSSTGIIPPFSTLIYEVELKKVGTND